VSDRGRIKCDSVGGAKSLFVGGSKYEGGGEETGNAGPKNVIQFRSPKGSKGDLDLPASKIVKGECQEYKPGGFKD